MNYFGLFSMGGLLIVILDGEGALIIFKGRGGLLLLTVKRTGLFVLDWFVLL